VHRFSLVLVCVVACGDNSSSTPAPVDAAAVDAAPDAVVRATLPDPRFKWVDAFSAFTVVTEYDDGNGGFQGIGSAAFGPAAAADLNATTVAAAIVYVPAIPVEPLTSGFELEGSNEVQTPLYAAEVMTSLAFPGNDEFAMTWLEPTGSATFSQQVSSVATADAIDANVGSALAEGYVTTALAYDGSAIDLVSYKSSADTSSYESSVVMAGSASDVLAQAQTLAGGGYIITAFGATDAGYALVGTRVAGSSTAHDVQLANRQVDGSAFALVDDVAGSGYAIVAGFYDPVAVFLLER
jgi:hypothetical protein